jgi:hypothetical protein
VLPSEPIAVMLIVTDALEKLGVRYAVGGSLASALYGVARATADADIVADLRAEDVELLLEALRGEFYMDGNAMREAIQRRASFNLIHLKTTFKVDVFVAKPRPFDQAQMQRRTKQIIAVEPERTAYIASAEDNILAKLDWYRLGGETSDRQWRDILGILRLQAGRLDTEYLRKMAATLGVADLLEKAFTESERS